MRPTSQVSWSAAIALAALCSTAEPARAQPIVTIARVIATSDVDGQFVHPVCDRTDTLRPSDNAAFSYALVRHASDPDDPLVVDMGGLLTPHGVARYAADHHPGTLARLVRDLGYDALAFGVNDLGAPRSGVLAVARALRERGIPMVASNLRCSEEAAALCDVLVDASDGPSMHMVNGRKTAVLSVLRPSSTQLVAPDLAHGIAFDPPGDTVARLTRLARRQGAELVVAVVDSAVEGGPIQFATQLPEDARPNLLLVSGDDEILFARPSTMQPVLVGASPNDAVEVRIRESAEIRSAGYEMLAQPLGGRGITVGEPVLDWIDEIGESYCEAWGRPLRGGHLAEPMDVDAMLSMAAEILREAAGADVAILNRDALDARWRPAQPDALTASDVFIALQYDEPLQTAEVDETWLQEVARRAQNDANWVAPGLSWTGSGGDTRTKVGGHPTEGRAEYSVVTIRFLAAGGDGSLPPLPAGREWRNVREASLRSVVLDYLERNREPDPRQTLEDPAGTLQWIFRADAGLTFSGSRIDNPRRLCPDGERGALMCDSSGFQVDMEGNRQAAYATTQLSQSDVLTFGFQLDAAANAAAPDWTWQNTANLLYSTAWTEPAGTAGADFVEGTDYIRFRSALSWRGLRNADQNQWYLPDPTVDLFVESEFTVPGERSWHWLLTRPVLGLRFQLLDKLQLQLSGGIQLQPLDPEMEVEAGAGATFTLAPWDLLKVGPRFARIGFTFDYFWTRDIGEEIQGAPETYNRNRGTLRGTIDGSFDLAGPLALVFRFNVLLQHEDGQEVGAAISGTAGIRLGYLGRLTGP